MSPINILHLLLVGLVFHVTVTEGLKCIMCHEADAEDSDEEVACSKEKETTCETNEVCFKAKGTATADIDGSEEESDFTWKGCIDKSWLGKNNECVDLSIDMFKKIVRDASGDVDGDFCLCDDEDLCNGSVKAGISFLMVILVACALWAVKF